MQYSKDYAESLNNYGYHFVGFWENLYHYFKADKRGPGGYHIAINSENIKSVDTCHFMMAHNRTN